jgi:hypothetical protein
LERSGKEVVELPDEFWQAPGPSGRQSIDRRPHNEPGLNY